MKSIFYIIIYTATVIFASDAALELTECRELDKSTVKFRFSYGVGYVIIKMNGKDYRPNFAALYSEKKEIGKFSCFFNGNRYVQWCLNNFPTDKKSLNNFFKKLDDGIFELHSKTIAFFTDIKLEILVGLTKTEVYKDIITRFIEARDRLDRDDPSNISAKEAITKKMDKECASNTIYYGIRFSDSHDDFFTKLEDYKVIEYERSNENYDYNEYAKKTIPDFNETKKNTSDFNETNKNDDSINENAKLVANDDNDTNNKADPTKINEEYYDSDRSSDNYNIHGDTKYPDENEYKRNNDKLSLSAMFKKTLLDVIGNTRLTLGVFGFMIFIGRFLYQNIFDQ